MTPALQFPKLAIPFPAIVPTPEAQGRQPVRWGPDNPHPLSQMRTELVWEGKYDECGQRRKVDVAGSAMPMQKIETVDMPRSEALASGQTTLGELSTTVRRYPLQADLCFNLGDVGLYSHQPVLNAIL